MVTVNVDGHEVKVRDDLLEHALTLRLIQKCRTDKTYSLDLLDRVIDGSTDVIFWILDPEKGDPHLSEVEKFLYRLFDQLTGDPAIKNSFGSQSSPAPASQPSEPTSSDSSGSASTTFMPDGSL